MTRKVSGDLFDTNNNLTFLGKRFPTVIQAAGKRAVRRFVEFFTAEIQNPNTRKAYAYAVSEFLAWCEARGLLLETLQPVGIAAYLEHLAQRPVQPQNKGKKSKRALSKPSIKQNLAAIRMFLDYMVLGQMIPMNPASSVRGPKYQVEKGKTPVLSPEDARLLLDSIDISTLLGLRDRALIAVMVYSFARVSAVLGMKVEDYYPNGKRWWFRLTEKGSNFIERPAHHNAESYLDDYIRATGIGDQKKTPLFRSAAGRTGRLTERPMHRVDAFRMIKRRVKAAALSARLCNHTFRATGITAYLLNGGTLEKAQRMAGHKSSRTTKLYDRRDDEITLDEVEKIAI
jgi:site-specific recombinase XerD